MRAAYWIDGNPTEIANEAIARLQARTPGVKYALIMHDDNSAQMWESWSQKCEKLEKEDPGRIVGYYVARRNMAKSGVTIAQIAEDIREALR